MFYGAFKYDDTNLAGQDAYSLANIRFGVRGARLFAEGLGAQRLRHALRPGRVPVRPGLAPSGFIGESGRPRTFGITPESLLSVMRLNSQLRDRALQGIQAWEFGFVGSLGVGNCTGN